jgi:maltose alpha-D-glucosyltransferase/alpha-amylase
VLRVEEDFVILDFDGDPLRPLSDRRARKEFEPLEPWAETWRQWVTRAFLRGYHEAIGSSPLLPGPTATETLRAAFTIEMALHELRYELTNRPEWLRIPCVGSASSSMGVDWLAGTLRSACVSRILRLTRE